MPLQLDTPLQFVKGVGPVRAEQFAELGLRTVGELLDHVPARYVDELGQVDIADLQPDVTATICGSVTRIRANYPGFRAWLHDGTGSVALRWFQRPRGGLGLNVGAVVVATGRIQTYNDTLEMVQPTLKIHAPDAQPPALVDAGPRKRPVYPASEKLPSNAIHRIVTQLLRSDLAPLPDPLPPALLKQFELPDRAAAIRDIHDPRDDAAWQAARRRLAFEELFLLELAMALRRQRRLKQQRGHRLPLTPEIDRRIRARFPFALTADQDAATREISADLAAGRPMTRLLQGDVGSGKTVVALYAALVAIANRRQAAVMAPTELLAQQHFRNISQYLADSRVRALLLTGALSRGERRDALQKIEAGEIDLVVGTQALIQSDVAFARLALVVVDEQHKFGVLQRATFRTKGLQPHYLVMTATPIPRTLALTVFGDLEVSTLRSPPAGRGAVRTQIVASGGVAQLYAEIGKRLEAGEQAYVVCPRVEEDDGTKPGRKIAGPPLVPATKLHDYLTSNLWRYLPIGLLHGRLDAEEKERTLRAFVRGQLQALVATTVVEVGVDVPNATIMVIENAEQFGLAQLHQLRGRIGRGTRDSDCYLVTRTRSPKAAERLAILVQTTDGFRIAEADLAQRGPGEFFGTRQHGLPALRVADPIADFALLEQARAAAFDLARTDPTLARPEHAPLLPALRRMFGDKLKLIDAA